LGNLHQKYGKFDAARDAFVRALELTPNKQIIMLELADVELKRGNVDEALALSKQAYELEPAHTKAGLFYLIMLLDAGRAEEAQTVALQYGNLTTNPDVLVIFVQNNEYERARNIWQAAVEQKTDDVNAILSLVAAHMRVGDAPRAIAEVERVVAIYPEMRAMGDDIIRQLQSQSAVPAQ
jgi:tetratricopeptide (TPR) repeat protein